jgi:hypothetical protein
MNAQTNTADANLNTDEPQAPAAGGTQPPAPPKVPTLAENMPTREIFPTLADAIARWGVIAAYPDAAGVRPFITGLTAEGTIDPATYPDSHEVMIAKLTELGDVTTDAKGNKERAPTRTVALVLHPIPKLETFLGVESLPPGEGTAELREIIRKELQHRSVRTLRILKGNYADESAVAEAQDKMPQTLAEYINGTRTGSGLLDAFNKHAIEALKRFAALDGKNKAVGEAFQRAKLSKATLRQALSNAAFAASEYGRLESAGLFLRVLGVLTARAKVEGLSTAAYENWAETRDQMTYDPTAIDLGSVDLGELFADDADESTPATDADAPTA